MLFNQFKHSLAISHRAYFKAFINSFIQFIYNIIDIIVNVSVWREQWQRDGEACKYSIEKYSILFMNMPCHTYIYTYLHIIYYLRRLCSSAAEWTQVLVAGIVCPDMISASRAYVKNWYTKKKKKNWGKCGRKIYKKSCGHLLVTAFKVICIVSGSTLYRSSVKINKCAAKLTWRGCAMKMYMSVFVWIMDACATWLRWMGLRISRIKKML